MKFEISKSSRIESVLFNNGMKYNLLDEYDECDGGIIISIDDREELDKVFNDDDVFYDMENNEVSYKDVVCELVIKDSSGGYGVYYNENGEMLIDG
jgi:hypothetical protein